MSIRIKRVREPAEPGDGTRVLVDRLWPRGVSKPAAAVDEWLPQVAPSHDLRRWFDHRPERWRRFAERYVDELLASPDAVAALEGLAERARSGPVTLLFDSREERFNNAVALRALLRGMLSGPRRG